MSDPNAFTPPAEATPTAPAAQPATPAAPAPFAATPQTAPQAPLAPAAPPVDPSWLKQRLDETRSSTARQVQSQLQTQYAQKEQEYQARVAAMEKQLQALVGVTPKNTSPNDQIRDQFKQVFPDLAVLEQRAKDIQAMLDRATDFESSTNHYWETYGRQTLDRLYSKASESLGAPLTDEGRSQLRTAFTGWVQSSPELSQRYSSDPSIVDDFMRGFVSSFIDPVRRTAAAGVQARVPSGLPQDTPGGAPRATPAPTFKDLDDRAAGAFAAFNASRNS
jgi:hypothetical protein